MMKGVVSGGGSCRVPRNSNACQLMPCVRESNGDGQRRRKRDGELDTWKDEFLGNMQTHQGSDDFFMQVEIQQLYGELKK